MRTNTKILFAIAILLISLATATIINVALNFRDYAIKEVTEKSLVTAETVRDGLTAHMINGVMDKRNYFLESISHLKNVEKLWIVRSKAVIDQYGEGFTNERPRDAIDKEVLKNGKVVRKIEEDADQVMLRITVPYIASAFEEPSCTQCHNVKDGDVLGAISMVFNINEIRQSGAVTILKIFGINLLFLIVALLIANFFLKPYIAFFADLYQGARSALRGDFSFRFNTDNIHGDGERISKQFNTLYLKVENTLFDIKSNLSSFIAKSEFTSNDPLSESSELIKELADIYKFKKTIELDESAKDIYERLSVILTEKFGVTHFAIFEVDKHHQERSLISITGNESSFCYESTMKNSTNCRAARTGTDVFSTDFKNVCQQCGANGLYYTCIPFDINDEFGLVLSISARTKEEIEEVNSLTFTIKNYLETAKPAIESKILMARLKESSLRDGLTKLYNRRFLDEFIDKTMSQAERTKVSYSILMIDIDYFKMVNDTYGHDAGDLVIKGLAEVITESIRKSDLAIRFGGEEFLVMLHNASEEGAVAVAEKIHVAFCEQKFVLGSETLQKTLSIGVAHFPLQADSIWKAIKFADTALYKAKNTGRNKVLEFDESMFEGESF